MKSNRCPNCGCPRIKNGKRRLKLIGTVQNYLCRNCGCQARDSDFTGYMYPLKFIDAAVTLYQSGITLEYIKTYKKGRYFWFWALKCPFTKLIVAWHVSETRELGEAKDFFKKAKKRFPIGPAFCQKCCAYGKSFFCFLKKI